MITCKKVWQVVNCLRLLILGVALLLFSHTVGAAYDNAAFVTRWKGTGGKIVVPFTSSGAQVRYYKKGDTPQAFGQYKKYSDSPSSTDCLKFDTQAGQEYILEIKGNIDKISMSNNQTRLGTVEALLSIEQWGTSQFRNLSSAFAWCINLEIPQNVIGKPNLQICNDCSFMFMGCQKLKQVDPRGEWNTGHISSMRSMFQGCYQFNDQNLSKWNVENVTSFLQMFAGCTIFKANLENWNVTRAINMQEMFSRCTNFTGNGLEKWADKVAHVTNFSWLFFECQSLNFDPTDWNIESVTEIAAMFCGCLNLNASQNLDFSKWSTKLGKVRSFHRMFENCRYFTGKGVKGWMPENNNVTNVAAMFTGCKVFNEDLSDWHVDNVEYLQNLFNECVEYDGKGIGKWNTSKVVSLYRTFYHCPKLQEDLKDWDVSRVTNMNLTFAHIPNINIDFSHWKVGACKDFREMFYGCTNLTSDLQYWDVSEGVYFKGMFVNCVNFNADLSKWRMRNATNTNSMFSGCKKFNADLRAWNLENVTDAGLMFYNCEEFQADLSRWQFKNLQIMNAMFKNCIRFDSDLRRWNVSHVRRMDGLFDGAIMFKGEFIGSWKVGECQNFSRAFANASAFIGNLAKWDMHSAENLSYMFTGANCENTDFSDWNIENVTTLDGMFENALGNISDVTGWNTKNVTSFRHVFYNAKGMQHPIGHWDYSSLPEDGEIGIEYCGMSVDAYNRTLKAWDENNTLRKPSVRAQGLYYSQKALHDTDLKAGKGFVFTGDTYVDKNLSLSANRMRLKVGQKKELKLEEQKGASNIVFSASPTNPKRVSYNSTSRMVEGLIPGKAVIRVTSNSMTNPPLHNLCDIEVYLPITELRFSKDEYDLAIGDVLDLRRKMKIIPYNASWPKRITFKVEDVAKEFVEINDPTSGRIKGLKEGDVQLTVETFDVEDQSERITKTLTIHVKRLEAQTIHIHPQPITLGVGSKVFTHVFFTPKNTTDQTVTREIVGDKTVASVDGVTGATITGKKIGECQLLAKASNGKESKVAVRVIANYVPVNDVRFVVGHSFPLLLGSSRKLHVSVTPANASNKQLYWESSNTEIAAVDQEGNVRGLREGKVRIKVSSVTDKLIYDFCEVDVYNNPVQGIQLVGDELVKIGVGEKYRLRYRLLPAGASNTAVACTSAAPDIVSVDQETAEVTGEKIGGPVEITIKALGAEDEDIELKVKVQCVSKVTTEKLIVKPSTLGLFPGEEKQLELQFEPADATNRDVTWTSSSAAVEVDENGLVLAKEAGTATIKCMLKSDNTIMSSCMVTVRPRPEVKSLEIRPQTLKLGVGNEYKLAVFVHPANVQQYEVEWALEDEESVLSFDGATQTLKGLKEGTAKVLVHLKDNPDIKAECQVTIVANVPTQSFEFDPTEFEIEFNSELNLNEKLKFTPEDATDRWMEWTSEQPDVVDIREGYVRTLAATSTGVTITAKLHSDPTKTATCLIKVKEPSSPTNIQIKPSLLRIKVGDVRELAVKYVPESATDRILEWSSSDTDLLTVDNGNVTALATGAVIVTARLVSNPKVVAVCTIEILDANTTELITNITVDDVTLRVGKSADLRVTYLPENLAKPSLIYEGFDPTYFVIADGKITGLSPTNEPVEVTAILSTDPGIRTTFKVTVQPIVPVESIKLNHEKLLIYALNEAYLRVITTPADADQTGIVWTSENMEVCTVHNGLVYGVAEGTTTVTATLNGNSATCEVTVHPQTQSAVDDAQFASLQVVPNPFDAQLRVTLQNGALTEVHYALVNAMGTVVRQGVLVNGETVIGTEALAPGFYILQLKDVKGLMKSVKVAK